MRLARSFRWPDDTFAFINQLYWAYDFSEGGQGARARAGPVEGGHLCVAMVRAARQFFYAARFDPRAPRVGEDEYRALVRAVIDVDPRRRTPLEPPVTIPGYSDLYRFSLDHEALLRAEIGGPLLTYVQRGNWRMIMPFSLRELRASAERWLDALERGHPAIVRVVNFPGVDINHSILLYAAEASPLEIRFHAYDPNDETGPVSFVFDRATATFRYPPAAYFRGGSVKMYEVYDGFLF